ncbi:MAG: collagenase, partial [Psychrosphaera sp.]|nr:collagenase [Psychrosphaera sp.]
IETVLYLLKREFRDNEDIMLDDPDVVYALEDYLDNSWMLGTDYEAQLAKGAALLGYFTTLEWYEQDNQIESTVDGALNRLFAKYSPTGSGKSLWGNAAGEAAHWGDCSKYTDVCAFETVFVDPLLSDVFYCDDFLNNGSNTRIRAQDMSTSQARETCEILDAELDRFSNRFGTNVVKNDHSDTLDMVIFDSKTDYQVYSPAIFGNNTNNGGIFLEGSPDVVGNEARFITFEYEDNNDPGFKIKNLEHEYVHYLDGRINKYGSFRTASPSNGGNTVWWSEGLAEYVAWQDNSEYAPDAMMEDYFTLSEVFRTDYNDSIAQIYDWGYAASRYKKELHAED